MTMQPPAPANGMPPLVPEYLCRREGRTSRLALGGMVLGIAAVGGSVVVIGGVVGVGAILLGALGIAAIKKDPARLGGKGFAITGVVLGIASLGLSVGALLMGLKMREAADRRYCAVNLMGISRSMVIYASEGMDELPVMPPPAVANTYTVYQTVRGGTTAEDTLNRMYATPGLGGDITASLWVLSLGSMVGWNAFVCRSDPHAERPGAISIGGTFNTNFGPRDRALSYSMAYPWRQDNVVGGWWRVTVVDGSIPLLSDMAPKGGTGNSANHRGAGQNVVYGDGHVAFETSPRVGQGGDNIWLAGSTAPAAGRIVTPLTAERPPYDTVMVPVRNASTGRVE